jgi:hypothetical protein
MAALLETICIHQGSPHESRRLISIKVDRNETVFVERGSARKESA